MNEQTIRLNKHLANLGICSRRDVGELLKEQRLTVNGEQITEPGTRIDPYKDVIKLNGNKIKPPHLVYYVLNKPKGVISTAEDEFGRKNVTALIPTKQRIYPVGRLDKETTGLLILTNDGELTNLLTHPKYHVEKVYRLAILGRIQPTQLNALRNGVGLYDGMTAPARVHLLKDKKTVSLLEMKIYEGRNRQIRRMCEAVGVRLHALSRIRFGPLNTGKLGAGQYRELSYDEIEALKNTAIANQSETKHVSVNTHSLG